MPGVKIGGESFVGAGIVVNEDIPKNSFVRGEIKLKISENKKTVDVKKREEFARKARSRHEIGNPPAAGALELKNKLKNGN
ncbi:hypothetical protein HZC20_00955 [Candidatus Peregrinibacteria bacterium]|nr:hypothetical protein [Candidatus Peregrinibacteria bacterium]